MMIFGYGIQIFESLYEGFEDNPISLIRPSYFFRGDNPLKSRHRALQEFRKLYAEQQDDRRGFTYELFLMAEVNGRIEKTIILKSNHKESIEGMKAEAILYKRLGLSRLVKTKRIDELVFSNTVCLEILSIVSRMNKWKSAPRVLAYDTDVLLEQMNPRLEKFLAIREIMNKESLNLN